MLMSAVCVCVYVSLIQVYELVKAEQGFFCSLW